MLDGGCTQTASGWDGPRYGASWAKSASEIEYNDLTDSARF
jgi:hypothetical protein